MFINMFKCMSRDCRGGSAVKRVSCLLFLLLWYRQGPKAASYFSSQSISKGKQGRNLGAGTEAETLEEHSLLACSLWLYHLAQDFLPRDNPVAVGWALQDQSLIRNMPHRLSYRPFWYRQFLSWGSLFDNPRLGQVNKKLTVHKVCVWLLQRTQFPNQTAYNCL